MNKLTCPHCKTPFEVDEQGYSSLVKQVRDEQFEKELNERNWPRLMRKLLLWKNILRLSKTVRKL